MTNEIDFYVGKRLRRRRRLLGLTQQVLGDKVGIRFQQIQKYECGANRISAARLFELSEALSVPIQYFYEGLMDDEMDMSGDYLDEGPSEEEQEAERQRAEEEAADLDERLQKLVAFVDTHEYRELPDAERDFLQRQKFAMIELEEHVFGILRSQDASRKRIDDMRKRYKVGDQVEAKCLGIDRKIRAISLSIKAIELDEEQAIKDYSRKSEESLGGNTLGDLFKGSMNNGQDSEDNK